MLFRSPICVVYGENLSFKTLSYTTASVQTGIAYNIALTTASVSGSIVSNGNPDITQYGFVYSSVNATPGLTDSKIIIGTMAPINYPSNYNTSLSNLTVKTIYYVRAFATNATGTVFGAIIQFTTADIPPIASVSTIIISRISYTSASFQGSILNKGTNMMEYGFVYSSTSMPTVANNKIIVGTTPPASTPFTFQTTATGLTNGTTYYVRSYAKDNSGVVYGENLSFATSAYVLPAVTTVVMSKVNYFTATAYSDLLSKGVPDVTEYGFVYSSVNTTPTISDSKAISGTTAPANTPFSFSSSLTNLTAGTNYHIRVYALNAKGVVYGSGVMFSTRNPTPLVATTRAPYGPDSKSVSANGSISSQEASAITRYGFVYGTSPNPTLANLVSEAGTNVTQAFPFSYSTTIDFTALPAGNYYIRSFASNASGTGYGTSIPAKVYFDPIVETGSFTYNPTTSTFNGTITDGGSDQILEYGIIYTLYANSTFGFEYGGAGVDRKSVV